MSKKRTGGGRFDPSEETVYFAAGNIDRTAAWLPLHRFSLMATNDLFGSDSELVRRVSQPGHCLLLDSGIFWLTNKHMREHEGMTMNEALSLPPGEIDGFDELWDAYTRLVATHQSDLWGYIELDQGGAENKRKTRAKLEALGLVPIPVYHPLNDGWDYFDELCSEYDRICVGNVVQADAATRKHLIQTVWERHRKYPDVWIHLLGITPSQVCTAYPPNSTDSATFTYSMTYGAGTTPFATSMNSPAGRLGRRYSYMPAEDTAAPGGLRDAACFLAAHASFMTTNWRNQQRHFEETFGQPILPPVDEREGVRL